MTMRAVLSVSMAACLCAGMQAQAPQAEISNGAIRAKVYTPDARTGFYRGTRFDWSGVISDLEFAGHHLYKPWFASTDETVRDFSYVGDGIVAAPNSAMTGPVEEFQRPIGYDTAKPGETFLKVGVGLLRKADNDPYQFGKHFELVDGGKWITRKTATSITFEQVLGGADSTYGYVYTKTLRLVGKESKLVIEHHLKNTGKTSIATAVYDHNFLTIDSAGVGSAYTVTVPYTIKPTRSPDPKFVTIEGSKATYIADLHDKDRVAFGLQGFGGAASDYDFRIANSAAQVEVRMQGDRPLSNASVWSIRDVLAVEPFVDISAEPGKEMSWSYTYTYTDLAKHR
ncbi:hypothetical protein [Terriglobus roseus]|uniref:Uncharacterized protein n=1 Tax=Terriglobus roseus TaxID=392734 RepID=A0A1H4NW09_9BACT|nr:hypothetical protein [Terriglobus roseus]SEB99363.1 hypothetical protein SAMN05443244_2377 [Terriglobus roseus]